MAERLLIGAIRLFRSPSSQTNGWRGSFVAKEDDLEQIDPDVAPLQYHLGLLGRTGITAYGGLCDVLNPQEGDAVFISRGTGDWEF